MNPSTPTALSEPVAPPLDLEATAPEVKRYHRLKLIAGLVSSGLSLGFLAVMGMLFGPRIDRLLGDWIGTNRWMRLALLGFIYAAMLQLLTLPLDFWSGFILEHRYELSTQSFPQWVWKQIKGDLVGGPLGVLLPCGFYAFRWY